MKKAFIAIFLILFIIIVLSILLNVYISPHIDDSNQITSNGLSIQEKHDAITTAINDERIKKETWKNLGNIYIGKVTRLEFNNKMGYINTTDIFAYVPISIGYSSEKENYIFIINLSNNKIMYLEHYWLNDLPDEINTLIPSGSYWYHQLYGATSGSNKKFALTISGKSNDEKIFPIIIDQDNLIKLKNGQSFSTVYFFNTYKNSTETFDGTKSISSGSKINIVISEAHTNVDNIIPANINNDKYYILIKGDVIEDKSIILNMDLP